MWGGGNVRRGGIAHALATLVAVVAVVACGDLQQAATGGGVGMDDDSTGAMDTDAPASTTGASADDGDGEGTGDGATLEPDTGALPEETGTSAGLDDTGSTGDPGDSGSTGDDGPLTGPHDGMYGGTFSAQFQAGLFNGNVAAPGWVGPVPSGFNVADLVGDPDGATGYAAALRNTFVAVP